MPRMALPAADPERRVESARYALLRRLAYAMRHHMVVHLQPIGMIIEVLERRLESPAPDIAQVRESMAKVNTHARAAVQSSLDVVTWLAPEDGKLIAFDAGVQECVDLLRSHLTFRGFALRSEVAAVPVEVSHAALRGVLPAVLLALTDHASSPAAVHLHAGLAATQVALTVEVRPSGGTPGFSGDPHYRLLDWDDVAAIAGAEGVDFDHLGDSATLIFRC